MSGHGRPLIHNERRARATQREAASIDGLSGMKQRLVALMAAPALFGSLPEGQAAAARLAHAANELISNLQQAGLSVRQIADNAGKVADIAGDTDAAALIESRVAHASPGGTRH
jgi:hypothetical protein